jgi:hypothetical protein
MWFGFWSYFWPWSAKNVKEIGPNDEGGVKSINP